MVFLDPWKRRPKGNGNCSDDAACLNGGSCHQVGDRAFKCLCTDQFTGTVFSRLLNGKAETDSSKRFAVLRKQKRSQKQAKYSVVVQATHRLKKKSKARRKRNYLTVDKSEASSSVFEIARGLRKKALKSVSLKTVETVSTKTLSSKQEAKK
ncbi:Lactadherin [Trichinella pseudospiralis]